MDGIAIWQAVEDVIMETFSWKEITEIDTKNMRNNWHQTYHNRTVQQFESNPEIVYQPSFFIDEVFVKCDFIVRNEEWTYDLLEVKAKNTIRKNTKAAPLLDNLIADCSIQQYVLQKALWEKFSGKCYLWHLNKEFIKNGTINPSLLTSKEEVTDELLTSEAIETTLKAMRESLTLSKEQFESRYPYPGTDYMTYFGEAQPKQSLWSISRLNSNKKLALYEQGKINLKDFTHDDVEALKNNKDEHTAASICLDLRMQWEEVINAPAIQEQLSSLQYPLYFYDYETMSVPVPLLDWASPWQQVVVQYSLHKIQKDWTITHHEALLDPIQAHDSLSLFAQTQSTNESILQQIVNDMDWCSQWTFIVRYKWFENSRNSEWAAQFPQYKQQLEFINTNTFDLMELFSKQLYFHRKFEWSSSIKKVLPVLTDISYDWMAVPNGAVAAQQLAKLIGWELVWADAVQTKKDLLTYCKQDTWAMVEIRKKVKEKVGLE